MTTCDSVECLQSIESFSAFRKSQFAEGRMREGRRANARGLPLAHLVRCRAVGARSGGWVCGEKIRRIGVNPQDVLLDAQSLAAFEGLVLLTLLPHRQLQQKLMGNLDCTDAPYVRKNILD